MRRRAEVQEIQRKCRCAEDRIHSDATEKREKRFLTRQKVLMKFPTRRILASRAYHDRRWRDHAHVSAKAIHAEMIPCVSHAWPSATAVSAPRSRWRYTTALCWWHKEILCNANASRCPLLLVVLYCVIGILILSVGHRPIRLGGRQP